jgi:Ca2+-binding EF-hand superfamily protein
MRVALLAAVLMFVATVPLAAQRGTGTVTSLAAAPGVSAGEMVVTVTGTNPCRAITIDYGDGTAPVTHAIRQLPSAVTHAFPRAGVYQVRARGIGVCAGEAARAVKVAGGPGAGTRFPGFDANGDGVIRRDEWRGTERSFQVHDWNGDGVLQGNEIQTGAARPRAPFDDWTGADTFDDWSEPRFRELDHNRDGRLSRLEWHYSGEEFLRADRNRDNALSLSEFLGSDFDDDRGDRFEFLDANNNGQIERGEWHASVLAFNWLDRDRNGVISRFEMAGSAQAAVAADSFAGLDVNRDQRISIDEWHWSRRSFDQRDTNQDAALTRAEFAAQRPFAGLAGVSAPGTTTVVVQSSEAWTDTGINVQAGDRLTLVATGSVQLSTAAEDVADPKGSRTGRFAPAGPLPRELAGILVARIGEASPIVIGARADALRAPNAGRLHLGVNDDHHADNTGTFNVVVTLTR